MIPSKDKPKKTEVGPTTDSQASVVEDLVAAAVAQHPRWSAEDCRKVITQELTAGAKLEIVAAAWTLCITDPKTTSPKRFAHRAPSCTWWAMAAEVVADVKAAEPRFHCTTCAPYQRGFIYEGGDPDRARLCPDCKPTE